MRKETIERIKKFNSDRNWEQFHSPANLTKGLSIEASELLECFLWDEENYNIDKVKEEFKNNDDFKLIEELMKKENDN